MNDNAAKGEAAPADKRTKTKPDGEFPDHSAPGSGAIKGGEAQKPGQMEGDEDQSPKD